MALHHAVPASITEAQHRASNPERTAWVSANAGSGKTHVLTQRVMRLLLRGVAPSKILCLTFTKAAAANMAMRVFDELSRWAVTGDKDLTRRILATGHSVAEVDLPFARRLFARTVETPGGLKIQTIHAFCERLLHLFPFEANVGAHFRVMEEDEQAELLAEARLRTLNEATSDPQSVLGHALCELSRQTSAEGFDSLLREALKYSRFLPKSGTDAEQASSLRLEIQALLGLTPLETLAEVERAMCEDGIAVGEWPALAQTLNQGSANDRKLANKLENGLRLIGAERLDEYLGVFFTEDNNPRGGIDRNIITKRLEKLFPGLLVRLQDEQSRLITLNDKRKAAQTVERSAVLALLLSGIGISYARLKDSRGALDFDDLISRTRDLLQSGHPGWVLYRLDAGIDHILVDEAQDTSQAQWDILMRLADEFFSGAGRSAMHRTFFAVGDEKQSIFSFQGAEPRLFNETAKTLARRLGDAGAFDHVYLKASFRSAPGVLETVDQVFALPANRRGLSAADTAQPVHEALKHGVPAHIELWDPIKPEPPAEVHDWRLPVDLQHSDAPAVRLATRIAGMIRRWLLPGSGEYVQDEASGRPRPIRPGDVIILVRQRNAVFDATIRALKEAGVPVAGADRLDLLENIAVMDLIAAGRAALLPEDDLTLACVLKSPLIGFDDDDLLAIAPARQGSVFEALCASRESRHMAAAGKLRDWQAAARGMTPFQFMSRLLGAEEGRCRLLARLGPEAGDAVDEFLKLALQHERSGAPSLQAFLTQLQAADINIKRDMEATGETVRVMTVHASKGLEAKIVLLPDTCGAPSGREDPKVFMLQGRHGSFPVWCPRAADDCATVAGERQRIREAAEDEHRRLLYVALTRAQERLYVMGFEGKTARPAICWFDMIQSALRDSLQEAPAFWDSGDRIRRRQFGNFDDESSLAEMPADDMQVADPVWLRRPAQYEPGSRPILRPSATTTERRTVPDVLRQAGRLRGMAVHTLIQQLAGMEPEQRRRRAIVLLQAYPDLTETDRMNLVEEAGSVLDHPDLAELFAPGSRAEVALAGRIPANNGRQISGRVDRLAIHDHEVLIADFKSDTLLVDVPPPAHVSQLALYAALLATLYPQHAIRTLLVYTRGPRIIEIDHAARQAVLNELATGTPSLA